MWVKRGQGTVCCLEEDATNLCVVDDLLAAGIPQNNIVLGFHHPQKRNLTEFAIT